MDVLRYNYTFTTKFILPLLFNTAIDHTKLFNESFINAYIADISNKENDDKIHLLFSDYPSISIQQNLPDPILEYETDEGYYILVYDLPKKYTKTYINFLEGNYSHFDKKAKEKIVSFWNVNEDTLLYGILYKKGSKLIDFWKENFNKDLTSFPKTVEWWRPPYISREIIGLGK
jgi:hypothetical protein